MEITLFILAGIVGVASPITISPNGNSPERQMVRGGIMIDAQKGLNPMAEVENNVMDKTNYEKSTTVNLNQPKLSLNERYRRLIPYMTFYYANDLVSPSTEPYSTDNVEIQKVQIEENAVHMRNAKKVMNIHPNRQVPRYQGNRLTKYNIASANPTSSGTKTYYPTYVHSQHSPSHNPLYLEQSFMNGHTFGRNSLKHTPNVPTSTVLTQSQYFQGRKPQQNLFHGDNSGNFQYYVPDKEPSLKYKLVPYEQTSLVRIPQAPAQNFHYYDRPKNSLPVPVLTTTNNQLYSKTRPRTPPLSYDEVVVQPPSNHLHSYPVTETYYDRTPKPHSYESTPNLPAPESGFMPMLPTSESQTAEHVSFVSSTTAAPPPARIMQDIGLEGVRTVSPEPAYISSFAQPEYYDYGARPAAAPVENRTKYSARDSATLSDILATLQKSKSIPQPITKDNVGSSIRTLLQVLNALKASALQYNEVEAPILSTPKPFVASPKSIVEVSEKPELPVPPPAKTGTAGLGGEDYLAPVHVPSQHLDADYRGSSQAFPLVIASEDDGGTPGRAGIDYPTLTTIPETSFDCKTQRYKGFFADPESKCQVWHYCDLNGGQASFLCPNGTIFSQAALTCDWWFNVQCDSTHQLYVLNERLYKYILPHSPKFPEDYSGPLVDKYLTLKFKEMEEQFRKNKKKTSSSTDEDDEVEANSRMGTDTSSKELSDDDGANVAVSESSVVVESPGNSGNVQHLEE